MPRNKGTFRRRCDATGEVQGLLFACQLPFGHEDVKHVCSGRGTDEATVYTIAWYHVRRTRSNGLKAVSTADAKAGEDAGD